MKVQCNRKGLQLESIHNSLDYKTGVDLCPYLKAVLLIKKKCRAYLEINLISVHFGLLLPVSISRHQAVMNGTAKTTVLICDDLHISKCLLFFSPLPFLRIRGMICLFVWKDTNNTFQISEVLHNIEPFVLLKRFAKHRAFVFKQDVFAPKQFYLLPR